MYIPPHNLWHDRAASEELVRQFSFGTLVTHGGSGLVATHMPFSYKAAGGANGSLFAHVARANSQWKEFAAGTEVLAVFQGEHGYVSPTWYVAQPSVPTWNYQAVHVYGVPRILTEPAEVHEVMRTIVAQYEAPGSAYSIDKLPPEYFDRMLKGIVAFEIPVSRWEAKSKLSQNQTPQNIAAVIAGLKRSEHSGDQRLAELMIKTHGNRPPGSVRH